MIQQPIVRILVLDHSASFRSMVQQTVRGSAGHLHPSGGRSRQQSRKNGTGESSPDVILTE